MFIYCRRTLVDGEKDFTLQWVLTQQPLIYLLRKMLVLDNYEDEGIDLVNGSYIDTRFCHGF